MGQDLDQVINIIKVPVPAVISQSRIEAFGVSRFVAAQIHENPHSFGGRLKV